MWDNGSSASPQEKKWWHKSSPKAAVGFKYAARLFLFGPNGGLKPALARPRWGLVILLDGLTAGGSFRAKKGKKGQKRFEYFCPFSPFLPLLVSQAPSKLTRSTKNE
jgi:hypothetical protein